MFFGTAFVVFGAALAFLARGYDTIHVFLARAARVRRSSRRPSCSGGGDRLVVLRAQLPAIVSSSYVLDQVRVRAQVLRFQRTLIWFLVSSDLVAFVFPNNSSDCFGFDSRENLHV